MTGTVWEKQEFTSLSHVWGRGSVVGLAIRLREGSRGMIRGFPVEARDVPVFTKRLDWLGRPPSPHSIDTLCVFQGVVKRPGHEAYPSPPSNVKIGNERSCIATPFICLYDMRGENFSSIITNRESGM